MTSPVILVDVGARGGIDARWKGIPVRVIGFEPDPEECAKLNVSPDEIYLPYALWSERVSKTLYLVDSPHAASFFEPNYEFISSFVQERHYRPKGTTSLNTISLDCAISSVNIKEVDFLKIDTEGAEMEILKGAGRTLQNVLAIELEVWFNPVQKETPFFADIDPFLRAAGFQLFDLEKSNFFNRDERWPKGQLVAGNALYFRVGVQLRHERLDRFLAVLEAYGFYDYALEVVSRANCLSSNEKRDRNERITRAGKRIRFRGKNRLALFFGKLTRRLMSVDQDYLGNITGRRR